MKTKRAIKNHSQPIEGVVIEIKNRHLRSFNTCWGHRMNHNLVIQRLEKAARYDYDKSELKLRLINFVFPLLFFTSKGEKSNSNTGNSRASVIVECVFGHYTEVVR